ncbi:hypothetical protein OXIME_001687 [Oxyplasma meridianum]|uniref:DUF4013 domain-containing protein n=1 Tax=Oxyplasma meridianum TaxID=3073602 RepID=A0AAX4NI13_9ARCH
MVTTETVNMDVAFFMRSIMWTGLPMLLIPPAIMVAIIINGNFYFLEYFHVISGSAWTGMDLVMGIFFAYIMKGLGDAEKAEVSKRLTPMMLFFMPAISTTTVTAGVYLALRLGISFTSPYFIVVAVLAIILTVQGLVIFLPNEARVYLELVRGGKDFRKIIRLTMINIRLSLIQLILQVTIILFMAHFATGFAL